jgi:hypothetical protein
MTVNIKRPAFVWALLLSIVLVNGFMAVPSVGHAEHHAHHQAGTHSTGICAWLCAAGQAIESTAVVPTSSLQLVERTLVAQFDTVLAPLSLSHFFRGPPVVFS